MNLDGTKYQLGSQIIIPIKNSTEVKEYSFIKYFFLSLLIYMNRQSTIDVYIEYRQQSISTIIIEPHVIGLIETVMVVKINEN